MQQFLIFQIDDDFSGILQFPMNQRIPVRPTLIYLAAWLKYHSFRPIHSREYSI